MNQNRDNCAEPLQTRWLAEFTWIAEFLAATSGPSPRGDSPDRVGSLVCRLPPISESIYYEVSIMKLNSVLRRSVLVAALTTCGLPMAATAQAQWGDLTGQFILDGDIPAPDEADSTKQAICAPKALTDELIVSKDSKGIANIFVFIPAKEKPKVHPDLKASKEKAAVLDQKQCRFMPHAQVMRTDQVLQVKSMDDCLHNTRTNPLKNDPANFAVPANAREGLEWKVKLAETNPTQIKCDIHPWMSAYVLVLDHPYAVVSDKDGKFKIEKLPAGELEFRYWHERPGYVEKAVKVTIENGKTKDLGVIKVKADKFAKQS
jgi:hypothetical protein